jgi:hypothetical protein
MRVVFSLKRSSAIEPATALLLPEHAVDALLDICVQLGRDHLPAIYPVTDGFVLKLRAPTTASYPGTIRLRGLAEDLLIPVDAELIPTLHEDEARGLVRDRGLIFLPGGRVLAYAPREPLALSSLVALGRIDRQSWQPFPAAREWAATIRRINLELPEPPAEEILEQAGQDIGSEDPRPDDSSLSSKVAGRGGLIAGQCMVGLGRLFHSRRLTELGTRLIQAALSLAPRLSEGLFGRQEAALRWLLREFREGNLEKALRRALPLLGSDQRGTTRAGGFRLPFHNLFYSLRNLLGRDEVAAVWYGGRDLQADLLQEYRRAAELAAAQGDHRRAAFIYGKLLRDFRSAANVLLQGGLCRDAALLYLTKVGDNLAAARAFAEAGEIDRALELYRQAGEHLLAGDLLRRAGEEEAAIVEYEIAAGELVSSQQDYLAAGLLLLSRAARPDLARPYFATGWAKRPGKNYLACAIKLAALDADEGKADELVSLLTEAEKYLLPPGNTSAAAGFLNEIARLADHPNLAAVRDDLRDRTLLDLAVKLRQRAEGEVRPGNLVSDVLGHAAAWDAAVVRDAGYALKTALERARPPALRQPQASSAARLQIGQGLVTAACVAPGSGDIFVGFRHGAVYCFRPSRNETVHLPGSASGRVASLATDAEAKLVVVLREREEEQAPSTLMSYRLALDEMYQIEGTIDSGSVNCSLAPLIVAHAFLPMVGMVGIWNEVQLSFLRGPLLTRWGNLEGPQAGMDLSSALLLPLVQHRPQTLSVLLFGPNYILYAEEPLRQRRSWTASRWLYGDLGWTPCIPEGSSLRSVPISWVQSERSHVELAGLTSTGALHWSHLDLGRSEAEIRIPAHNGWARVEGFLATTLLQPGRLAAVSRSAIYWVRAGSKEFSTWATTRGDFSRAIACFSSYRTRELIVICSDGVALRVPVPGSA